MKRLLIALTLITVCCLSFGQNEPRPRARDLGIKVGVLPTGPLNALPLKETMDVLRKYNVVK